MTTPSARVSVIMRTKDRARLLSRALRDVAAQTYDDWQLIVVNDGGEPAAVDKAVADVAGLRDRVYVLHHETSLGMEAASNRAVAASTGEFVVVHDDDDTWAPDFLSATVQWLDENPENVGVSARTDIIWERVEDDEIVELGRSRFGPPHDVVTVFDLLVRNQFVPISLLVRRSALDAIGGFDEELPVVGDWEFHLRLARHGQIGFLAGPVRAFWHQRRESTDELANSVNGADDMHKRFDRLVRERELQKYIDEHGIGALLYLTKFIEDRIAASERHTRAKVANAVAEMRHSEQRIVEAVQYYSIGHTIKRNIRRIFRRDR